MAFLLIIVSYTSLYAKNLYIKVMAISYADALFSVQHDLDELGYKMYVAEYENWYRVYTGPFKSQEEANKALSRVRKFISKDAFITTLNVSQAKVIPSKPELIITKNTNFYADIAKEKKNEVPTSSSENFHTASKNKYSKNAFVGFTAGISKLSFKENNINGDVPLNFELKDSGVNYGIEAGYGFSKNIFMTINYQRTDLENIAFNHAFSSLNYKWNEFKLMAPYFGVLAGYSSMTWKNSPIDATTSTPCASSFISGAQVGSEIPIYYDFTMVIFYRYFMMDYTTNIKTRSGEKEITHNGEQNLNMGIRYNF